MSNRFSGVNSAKKVLSAYMHGAEYGVAGHFFSYPPIAWPSISFENSRLETLYSNYDSTGMYIHWPYCALPNDVIKCDFCCSNVRNDRASVLLRSDYFNALIHEIELYSGLLHGRPVKWLYIGGGTPLTISNSELRILFQTLYHSSLVDINTYISVETRPELVTNEALSVLTEFNVSRISIGVESFSNRVTERMGRYSGSSEYKVVVSNAMSRIKSAKIKHINIDLIYGHPYEYIEDIENGAKIAAELMPDSIAFYPMGMPKGLTKIEHEVNCGLSIKPLKYRKECYEIIKQILSSHSYSMVYDCIWIRDGEADNKILNQWNQTCSMPQGIWVGIGVGSIGNIEDYGPTQNENDIGKYIKQIKNGSNAISKGLTLNKEELMRLEIITGVIHRSIDACAFQNKHGEFPQNVFYNEFSALLSYDFIDIKDNLIYLRPNTIPYLQAIARLFHSKDVENEYRKDENSRLDYIYYGITYSEYE